MILMFRSQRAFHRDFFATATGEAAVTASNRYPTA